MKKTSKVIYANMVNFSGLYAATPVRMKQGDFDGMKWWDSTGDFDASLGIEVSQGGGSVRFGSKSREEVAAWGKGVQAAFQVIRRIIG